MEFFKLVFEFARLKATEANDWAERRIAAFKAGFVLMLVFFAAPFLLAIMLKGFGAGDGTVSKIFGIGLLGTMILMILSVYRLGKLLAGAYGIGYVLAKVFKVEAKDANDDGVPDPAFTGKVIRTFWKGCAWMLWVMAFYTVVPMWRGFVPYVVSLAIVSFVTYYILGYAEKTETYRKKLFFIAILTFMGVVMVSLGLVRFVLDSGDAAWQKLPSIMMFSTAVALAVAGFACLVSAALAGDHVKDALKLVGKTSLAAAIVIGVLVLLFGDMTWMQARQAYTQVKAVGDGQKWLEDKAAKSDTESDDDPRAPVDPDRQMVLEGPVTTPDPGPLTGNGGYTEPAPSAPGPGPSVTAARPSPPTAAPVEVASKPPNRAIQKPPRQGSRLGEAQQRLNAARQRLTNANL